MPLYSNILIPDQARDTGQADKEKEQVSKPSSSLKLLQDHLISKRRAKHARIQPNKVQKTSEKSQVILQRQRENEWILEEEYDPMIPNSYEVLQSERIKAEEQRLAMRKSGGRIDLSILDALDRIDDDDESLELMGRSSRGTAIAPPSRLNSTVINSKQILTEPKISSIDQPHAEKLDGKSAAAKIMAKMGYKSGQGLGKDEQGISVPLEFEKDGTSVARIVQQQQITTDCERTDLTRVMLLQNMVGPGQVDDELEAETKEECTKYGEVVKCLIYEIANEQVPENEAVRIFVEFKNVVSTRKAITDLNGRYFGGRIVKATFYDENKFNKYELAP